MTTALEASFLLDAQLVARLAAGLPAYVEQIDAVLCEDGATVMCYVYYAGCNDHDCTIISYDFARKPQDFDRNDTARRLLCDDYVTLH